MSLTVSLNKRQQWTLLVRLCCEEAAYIYNMALVYFFDSFGYLTVLLLFWVYKYGLLRTQNSLHNIIIIIITLYRPTYTFRCKVLIVIIQAFRHVQPPSTQPYHSPKRWSSDRLIQAL